jgi:chorismate mutase
MQCFIDKKDKSIQF